MSSAPELEGMPQREHWGSRFGVILAVAGSAVGLGNFLRFPGVAVNNGGGAFMIPYLLSFLLLGIPICWCEWTMGRLGGRFGQNNGPGVMYALWRKGPSKAIGALTLFIPIVVYMYYVVVEAWCLYYAVSFFSGSIGDLFAEAVAGVANQAEEVGAIVGASAQYFTESTGLAENGSMLTGGNMIWAVVACFAVNFVIIYRGVSKGIESFCTVAMPLLIVCAIIILFRAMTLPGISAGLGFMWNPRWETLRDPQVWLAAAGQIFFSLSVGFGLILCYSSYLRKNDDVVLTSLSASSTNEFCEVVLGGLIVVPTAFLFLGAENATGGTFGLGFVTLPAIMHFMPGGSFFGGMWFGLLFLAAVTSSLSMLQPAIAFLEDGFGLKRTASVLLLVFVTAAGTIPTMYFTHNLTALDHTDFWCNFAMIVAATCQVLIFGWVIGATRGVREANRGADFPLPRFMPFIIRYVTPTFLIIILGAWSYTTFPGYIRGMSPDRAGTVAARGVYENALVEHFADEELSPEALEEKTVQILGAEGVPDSMPEWLNELSAQAADARAEAEGDAGVARFVFIGLLVFFALLLGLTDIACRNRIGRTIRAAEASGVRLES